MFIFDILDHGETTGVEIISKGDHSSAAGLYLWMSLLIPGTLRLVVNQFRGDLG